MSEMTTFPVRSARSGWRSEASERRADEALVARLMARDPTAVDDFYRRYRHRILAVAMRTVRDSWDAEEVLQDVVWTVFRKAEGFRGEAEFSSWLFRVTTNSALMLLRKRKRLPVPTTPEYLEPGLDAWHGNDATTRPEWAAEQRQLAEQIGHHVDALDPLNRDIFLSAAVGGDAAEEVSARTGLSILAVKARLHRVRASLRQAIEGGQLPLHSLAGESR
jgi:RNA polymerase sigma-70 factor (ECF subfamily)